MHVICGITCKEVRLKAGYMGVIAGIWETLQGSRHRTQQVIRQGGGGRGRGKNDTMCQVQVPERVQMSCTEKAERRTDLRRKNRLVLDILI